MAERIGLTQQAWASYEAGRATPPANTLALLADLYGLDANWLLLGKEPEKGSGPFPQPEGALVPVLGEIPAGTPMERALSHHAEDYLRIDPSGLSGPGDTLFALRVVGESMVGACILPGDYAVCSLASAFEVGDVVAVYQAASGEATVKQLGAWDRKTGRALLVPFNVGMAPFQVTLGPGDQVRRVVAVVRRLPVRAR